MISNSAYFGKNSNLEHISYTRYLQEVEEQAGSKFHNQGWNACTMHWELDSLPLDPREVPITPSINGRHAACYTL